MYPRITQELFILLTGSLTSVLHTSVISQLFSFQGTFPPAVLQQDLYCIIFAATLSRTFFLALAAGSISYHILPCLSTRFLFPCFPSPGSLSSIFCCSRRLLYSIMLPILCQHLFCLFIILYSVRLYLIFA